MNKLHAVIIFTFVMFDIGCAADSGAPLKTNCPGQITCYDLSIDTHTEDPAFYCCKTDAPFCGEANTDCAVGSCCVMPGLPLTD